MKPLRMPKVRNAPIFSLAKCSIVALAAFFVLFSSVHKFESSASHREHSEACELCNLSKTFNFVDSAPLELNVSLVLIPAITRVAPVVRVVSGEIQGIYDSRAPPLSI